MAAGGAEGIHAMLMFMILYMIDVTGFFACLMALSRDGKPMETMDDMAGLMRERPGMALAMSVFAISALGFPPFSGFWAKIFVFRAIIDAGYSWVAVVGLVLLLSRHRLTSSPVAFPAPAACCKQLIRP